MNILEIVLQEYGFIKFQVKDDKIKTIFIPW